MSVDRKDLKFRGKMSFRFAEILVPKYWIERVAYLNGKKGRIPDRIRSVKEMFSASELLIFGG